MTIGFIGLPGSGKTFWLVKMAIEYLKKGLAVFANFPIKGCRQFDSFESLLNLRNCLIIVDEANLWLPSRLWEKIPPWVLYRLAQTRKYQTDIFWSSQTPDRVDKTLREITNLYGHCKQIWPFKPKSFLNESKPRRWSLHRITYYFPEEYGKEKAEKIDRTYFFITRNSPIFKFYDSLKFTEPPKQ